jgi:hypothetical protein
MYMYILINIYSYHWLVCENGFLIVISHWRRSLWRENNFKQKISTIVCLSWIHQGDVNIMLHKNQKKYFFLSRLSLDNIQLMTLDEVNTTIYQPLKKWFCYPISIFLTTACNNTSSLFYVYPTLFSFSRHFVCFKFYSSSGESHRWIRGSLKYYFGELHIFYFYFFVKKKPKYH